MFVIVLHLFITGMQDARDGSEREERRMVEQSVRRAVVSCYAIKGYYPESLEYILDNFDVRYNQDKYIVHYSVFAENIMPDITVIEVIR
jgi:hypothetical protein